MLKISGHKLVNLETATLGRFCPVCKQKNAIDATVCVYCNSPLVLQSQSQTTSKQMTEEDSPPLTQAEKAHIIDVLRPLRGIRIYVVNSSTQIIIEEDRKEFILGRRTQDAEDELVDLFPFGAYDKFVSRRHTMIRKTENGYEIVDLNSANGTWLDNKRLTAGKTYPLPNGSLIRLGQLSLFVYYANTTEK